MCLKELFTSLVISSAYLFVVFFVSLLPAPALLSFAANQLLSFKYSVEPPVATTSPQRPVFQNTKSFQGKSHYLEILVSDHFYR